jgi:DNA-binding transcriptional MerR regulator
MLRVIRGLARLGFNLDEIADLIEVGAHRDRRPRLRDAAAAKLAEVEGKIMRLQQVRATLADVLTPAWRARPSQSSMGARTGGSGGGSEASRYERCGWSFETAHPPPVCSRSPAAPGPPGFCSRGERDGARYRTEQTEQTDDIRCGTSSCSSKQPV